MKFSPCTAASAGRGPVGAQFSDHQFSHGVIEIGGIEGASRSLLAGIAGIGEGILAEHFLGFGNAHAAGMQADGRQQSHVGRHPTTAPRRCATAPSSPTASTSFM